jgi:peptidoglycan/xylan/chitin deacetylase (PgdA/CDA1 family)/O-antigen ligase
VTKRIGPLKWRSSRSFEGKGSVPEAAEADTGRRLDRLGLALLTAAAIWVLVSATVSGGDPLPMLATFGAVAVAVLLGRKGEPVVVAGVLAAAPLVVAIASPIGTFSPNPGFGIFDYANSRAAFFVQAVAATAALWLTVEHRRARWVILGIGLAFAMVPFVARSYGAVAGVALVAAAVPFALSGRGRRTMLVLLSGITAAAVAGSLWLALNPPPPQSRLTAALDARRISLWGDAVEMVRSSPVAGVGPGRFDDLRTTAPSDDDAGWAHNDFLQQAAETGLPGLGLLVAGFGWAFARLWSARSRVAILAAASVAALGIQASFDHVLHNPPIPIMAAALVGTATSHRRRGSSAHVAVARKLTKAAVLPLGQMHRRRPGDLSILLYHRVGTGDGEISLPEEEFEHEMAYLAERERVLTLDEALDGDRGGVVVTFDDGYRDFHEHALPVLVRYGVPATLYLATGLVANGSGPSPEALTWGQLAEATSTGLVTVGSHTHRHADLSRATEAQAEEEMRRSRDLVEDHLSRQCGHFAYPWAVGSPAADRAVRRTFRTAALDAWKTNRRGSIDRYRLGRTPILRSDGPFFFRAKVEGKLDGEALLYKALRRGPWRPS